MTTLVLGAGVSGLGVARLLHRLDRPFEVYDERATGELVGVPITSGPWDPAYLIGIDQVVTSPGFAETSDPIRHAIAEGIEVRSELDLAASFVAGRVVAVTGTNGKTTTTELIHAMCRQSGLVADAAGNIGTALSDLAEPGAERDVAVVEASSFQLRFAETFHPDVAVVLGIDADHLDWHGDVEAYVAAKARITEHQGRDDVIVHAADDDRAAAIAAGSAARPVPVSGRRRPAGGHGPEGGRLHIGPVAVPVADLAVADEAYLVDLAAAGAAALAVGATPEGVETVVRRFHPGPHRRAVVATADGITWVDDSKATNPHAAAASIAAFDRVVLVAGGRNKGLDLAPIVGAGHLVAVLAVGEAAGELEALAPDLVTDVGTVPAAVARAAEIARPGDTVLLAPGCASFDQFPSYAARGDAFAAAVAEHVGQREEAV